MTKVKRHVHHFLLEVQFTTSNNGEMPNHTVRVQQYLKVVVT